MTIPRKAIREICEAAIALRDKGRSVINQTISVQTGGCEACVEGFGFVTISAEWLLKLIEREREDAIEKALRSAISFLNPDGTDEIERSVLDIAQDALAMPRAAD